MVQNTHNTKNNRKGGYHLAHFKDQIVSINLNKHAMFRYFDSVLSLLQCVYIHVFNIYFIYEVPIFQCKTLYISSSALGSKMKREQFDEE